MEITTEIIENRMEACYKLSKEYNEDSQHYKDIGDEEEERIYKSLSKDFLESVGECRLALMEIEAATIKQ